MARVATISGVILGISVLGILLYQATPASRGGGREVPTPALAGQEPSSRRTRRPRRMGGGGAPLPQGTYRAPLQPAAQGTYRRQTLPRAAPATMPAATTTPYTPLGLEFNLPPLPAPLETLPNRMRKPVNWAGADWGPLHDKVDWSKAEPPLWRRELDLVRRQRKFPWSPADLHSGDVIYAKHLEIFRAAPKEVFSILEVGLHPDRAPLFSFFESFLPQSKYVLFAKDHGNGPKNGTALANFIHREPSAFIKGVTSEASAQEEVQKKLQTVDIIVGRAADGISGQLEAFRYFFVNLLRPGGVYFIEDIDMNFISTPDTDECVKTRTLMIDYLRDMISAQINHDWYMTTAGEYRADPFVNNWVQDVSCSRGSCVVTKKLKLFNRYANLVHSPPITEYDTAIMTSRPPALRDLFGRDQHPNTDISKVGPMSRPVRIGKDLPLWANDANIFKVNSDRAGSDKCAAIVNGHQYHAMYSKVFAPWRAALKKKHAGSHHRGGQIAKDWKMLEVGIGCDTAGDPAGGYRLYSQYIPNVEYNAFEFQWSLCALKFSQRSHIRGNLQYLNDHVHMGDQSNYDDLKNCIKHFGTFDIIVDDGSHVSSMQISTFREMFIAALKPGGVFVLEDIQTSFFAGSAYGQSPQNQRARLTAVDILRDMIVSLNYPSWLSGYNHQDALYRADEPVMNWVEDIMCSREACAIQKRLTPLSSGGQ